MKKRKKYFLFLILIGLIYFAYSFHSENKKYEIINEIFDDTEFYPDKICFEESTIRLDNQTNNLMKNFSWIDTPSAYSQILVQNLRKLLSIEKKLKSNKIILKDKTNSPEIISDCSTEMKQIKKGKETILFVNSNYSISFPILSADNKTAIIQIENHCGMLCGNGDVYLFKKIDGKWKLIEKKPQWIS